MSLYVGPILLRGDMIASLSGEPKNLGNMGDRDFAIHLPDATALGTSSDLFRLIWHGNLASDSADTEFRNGQFWRLERYDPADDKDGDPRTGDTGWTPVKGFDDSVTPRHDIVSGLGAGDDYVVLSGAGGFLLYDIRGGLPSAPTTLTYLASDENGDPDKGDNDGNLDFVDAYAAICFCAGTSIATPDGPRAVETLRPGDLVLTRDRGARPLRWTGRQTLPETALRGVPHLRPIRIAAGALGPGLPVRDLLVSPQHRLMVRSRIARRMTAAPEVLVAARHLCGLPGIAPDAAGGPVSYHHLLFDRHELVFAEGALAESLFVGPQALRAMSAAARAEIGTLFPRLVRAASFDEAARPILCGRVGRKLARRHARNRHPLVEEQGA